MLTDRSPDTVFFPGAGSFGGECQPLVGALEPRAWCVRYPGRFGAGFGVPADSFDAVVGACVDQTAGRGGRRVVLLGHSFGAYVAYATAARLGETDIEVAALVTAGATAPSLLTVDEQATGGPRDAAAYLDRIDPGILAAAPSEEWREIVLGTLVDDLRLLRRFDTTTVAALGCPIFATRGQADPLTSPEGIAAWADSTRGAFSARTFPGGHSDFLGSADYARWLRETLETPPIVK